MQNQPESLRLDQLKNEENASFEALYRLYYPAVKAHIIRNQGSTQDAEDIFQEAVLVLLQQLRQADFVLTATLKTYLFAIARNLWLNRLRAARHSLIDDREVDNEPGETALFELQQELTSEDKLTLWLTKITERCQRILKAIFFYREPMESLMLKMGWKNRHTAANQQYKCIQQMRREKDKQR